MKTAIYFDGKLNDSVFIKFGKEMVEDLAKKYNLTILDYSTVSDFLRDGNEKALIFAQDIVPDTAYNNSYVNLFNKEENLMYNFIREGGIVTWLGDVPFFYRIKCINVKVEVDKLREEFSRQIKYFNPINYSFYEEHLYLKKVGDELCYHDIIYDRYIDITDDGKVNIYYRSVREKILDIFSLSDVCYLNNKVKANLTIVGRMLKYKGNEVLRPLHLGANIIPLNTARLHSGSCKGYFTGAWIKQIGDGYFIRLYDYDEADLENSIKVTLEVGNVPKQIV